MIVTMLPVSTFADTTVNTWADLADAVSAAPTNGTETVIEIGADLVADSQIDIPNGANIVIQIGSGGPYTATRDNAFTLSFFSIISGAKLTLKDITLDGNAAEVTADFPIVYVFDSGEFTMDTGAIIQNAKGNIVGNSAGVCVEPNSTMTMKDDAVIRNVENTNANGRGALLVMGTLNMEGGSVTGNITEYGGVHAVSGAAVNLSGEVDISGNQKIDGVDCNLYLEDGAANIVALTSTTPIGVTTGGTLATGNPIDITAASDQDWSSYFTSDAPSYIIQNSGIDNLQILQLDVSNTINVSDNSGSLQILQLEASTTIDISDSSGSNLPAGVSYDISSKLFNIDTLANNSTITVMGATAENTIAVATDVTGLALILSDVSITDPLNGRSPIELQGTADVTIELASGTDNTLNASARDTLAGLCVPSTATVTINGAGSLIAAGGKWGAGIGGGSGVAGGTINISDGTVTATGGQRAAGIGGGNTCAGGTVYISGGTVTAAGGQNGAGIGGGITGAGGTVSISGGIVTATGGQGGAGIGGGAFGSSGIVNITGTPDIMAASDSSKPAIYATSGSGNVINATLNNAISTNLTYLECNGNELTLPGNYKNFAFSAATASGVNVYSDQAYTTLLGIIMTNPAGLSDIPVIDLSTAPTVVTPVLINMATIIVKKNGSAWSTDTPTIQLSTSNTDLQDVISATGSNGVYTFTGIDPATTYYVWDTTSTAQYTNQSVTITSSNATVNYYTVQFAVIDAGTASGSTKFATYNSVAINTGDVVLGGKQLVITAVGQGASSYTYAWSGAGTSGQMTAALTIASLSSAVNATCTVTGAPASTIIDVGDSSGTNLPTGVTYAGNIFTIGTGANNKTINVVGTTNTNTIAVATGVTDLTLVLNGVSITSATVPPIDLQGNADVTLQLADGTVSTMSAANAAQRAGIHIPSGATLTIEGTGSLTTQGCSLTNKGGVGIGGHGGDVTAGKIVINSGIIRATGGSGSAGIGGGPSVAGSTITINGGNVTATGGGAGIGGGVARSGGMITIGGNAIVAATGGNFAAGIGGGGTAGGDGGTISIGGTAIVTAIGGYGVDDNGGGAGIGGGRGGASGTITISGTPIIMASSYTGSLGKPALDAASGSGSFISAKLNSAISATAATYLKCAANILPLNAKYQNFAFSTPTAMPVSAYSDQACNTSLGIIVQVTDSSPSISVTDLSTSPANVTAVKLQSAYTATVTVRKDGSAWTGSTPTIKLYTSSSSQTGELAGTVLNGVYTFTGINPATTYYVWNTTDNRYIGRSITSGSPNATVNYYTVTLSSTAGIASTSGSGTYLSGSDVPISAAVTGGYNWSKWVLNSNGDLVSTTNAYTITSISSAQSYKAVATASNAPTIQTASLPDGTVGTAYSQNLSAASLSPFTLGWSIASGSLPAGLTIDPSTGAISGTPSASGTFNFTVQAADSNGSSTKALSITINPAADPTIDDSDFSILDAVTYTGSGLSPTAADIAAKYAGTAGLRESDISNIKVDGAATQTNNGIYNITFDVAAYSGHYSAVSVTIANGFVINKLQLTITSVTATNKVYDGNNAIAITGGTLAGVAAADTANVVLGGIPTGTTVDANVGNIKAVTVTGYTITGTAISNYTLAQPTGVTATINPAAPVVVLANKTAGYTGSIISIAAADVTGINSETLSGTVTYIYYTDLSCITQTTTANSGAASNGTAPVNAGTYYVKATIAANGNYSAATSSAAALTITTAPTYSIALTPTGNKTFTAAPVGYGAQTAYTVTINNTGNQATGALTIALGGTNASSYILSKTSTSSIAVSGNDSFTVVPNTGLSVGTYTAIVTVFGSNSISATFNVSFTCNGGGGGSDRGNDRGNDGGSGGDAPTPTPASTPTHIPIIVDNNNYYIGNVAVEDNAAKITVDQAEFDKQLAAAEHSVVIPVTTDASTVVAQLVVKNVQDMNDKGVPLSIQTGSINYNMPASSIDTKAILSGLGATDPSLAPVNVIIKANIGPEAQALVNSAVKAAGAEEVVPALQFEITADYNGKTYKIESFNRFVSRSVEITSEQAQQITTAIVIDPDGTTRHVPTFVYQKNGKWYAQINSLTNSTYTLIFNRKSFSDAEGKWYQSVVQEMGSRKIINGVGSNSFAGNNAITRAEFAAIVVRALGLPANDKATFSDVPSDSWYSGAVAAAAKYGIVGGIGNNKFAPDAKITREQAMQMIYNASRLTPYAAVTGEDKLKNFIDYGTQAVWATNAVNFNINNGFIQGSNGKFNPKSNITRAETAVVVLRLLQKSGLVDVRTKL